MFTQDERRREERRVEKLKFQKEVKERRDEMLNCLDLMYDELEATIENLAASHDLAEYQAAQTSRLDRRG